MTLGIFFLYFIFTIFRIKASYGTCPFAFACRWLVVVRAVLQGGLPKIGSQADLGKALWVFVILASVLEVAHVSSMLFEL